MEKSTKKVLVVAGVTITLGTGGFIGYKVIKNKRIRAEQVRCFNADNDILHSLNEIKDAEMHKKFSKIYLERVSELSKANSDRKFRKALERLDELDDEIEDYLYEQANENPDNKEVTDKSRVTKFIIKTFDNHDQSDVIKKNIEKGSEYPNDIKDLVSEKDYNIIGNIICEALVKEYDINIEYLDQNPVVSSLIKLYLIKCKKKGLFEEEEKNDTKEEKEVRKGKKNKKDKNKKMVKEETSDEDETVKETNEEETVTDDKENEKEEESNTKEEEVREDKKKKDKKNKKKNKKNKNKKMTKEETNKAEEEKCEQEQEEEADTNEEENEKEEKNNTKEEKEVRKNKKNKKDKKEVKEETSDEDETVKETNEENKEEKNDTKEEKEVKEETNEVEEETSVEDQEEAVTDDEENEEEEKNDTKEEKEVRKNKKNKKDKRNKKKANKVEKEKCERDQEAVATDDEEKEVRKDRKKNKKRNKNKKMTKDESFKEKDNNENEEGECHNEVSNTTDEENCDDERFDEGLVKDICGVKVDFTDDDEDDEEDEYVEKDNLKKLLFNSMDEDDEDEDVENNVEPEIVECPTEADFEDSPRTAYFDMIEYRKDILNSTTYNIKERFHDFNDSIQILNTKEHYGYYHECLEVIFSILSLDEPEEHTLTRLDTFFKEFDRMVKPVIEKRIKDITTIAR